MLKHICEVWWLEFEIRKWSNLRPSNGLTSASLNKQLTSRCPVMYHPEYGWKYENRDTANVICGFVANPPVPWFRPNPVLGQQPRYMEYWGREGRKRITQHKMTKTGWHVVVSHHTCQQEHRNIELVELINSVSAILYVC